MPDSPLQAEGAAIQPSGAAALHNNEYFTGMWTQGNPLGPGAVPYVYQKFYSALRYDRLIGGSNVEVTTRLTLGRRPGNSVYNAGPFPPLNRFYEFRSFTGGSEQIHILGSFDPDNSTPSPVVLNVTATQVVHQLSLPAGYYTVVTFDKNVPDQFTGQTYTFAGLTTNVALNGQTLPPVALGAYHGALTPNQQVFLFGAAATGVVADTGTGSTQEAHASVRDVTGPANNIILWSKDKNAGRTSFQAVGNICYFADGVDAKKWIQSKLIWKANSSYNNGDFLIDPNLNIQQYVGQWTGNIVAIQVTLWTIPGPVRFWRVNLFFDPTTPVQSEQLNLTLAGLTTRPAINGQTFTFTKKSQVQMEAVISWAAYPGLNIAYSAETGTASTGNGITGATQPAWAGVGSITADGGAQWVNKGSAVQDWGTDAAAGAPIVTQAQAPTIYGAWQANTWYAPLFVILDTNGNLQQLTVGGVTGGGAPAWSVVVGAITADGACSWKCLGPAAWAATTVYAPGAAVQVQFTYYITKAVVTFVWENGVQVAKVSYVQEPVTVTTIFQCIVGGTSGTTAPSWTNGLGTTVADNTVQWKNVGNGPAWPGAGQNLSLDTTIVDPAGYLQKPTLMGKTGAVIPAFKTDTGATTLDTAQQWINAGPFAPAGTGALRWAYSPKNSITGHIGTATDKSQPIIVAADSYPVIQGAGFSDPQIDTIVLWRTVQDGATLIYDDEFPNPGGGQSWIYTDTNQDSALNELITAPIAHANDRPPAGFTPQCYYLTRIWGFVGNDLYYSGGPDVLTGVGNESFAPNNKFTFPSAGVKCWPTSIGLIVYTNSDVWAVLGQGVSGSPFYVVNFQQGVGLANQDAIDVNGSTGYGMLTSGQVVSMDPGAGELEVGFPIGDQFDSLFDSTKTYVAWHQGSSSDMALYVSDGSTGWFRMSPVAAPESGHVWSPFAEIVGGVKAIASVETSPGIKRLLLGPAAQGAPILMRDLTTNQDNGQPYQASVTIGTIVLAKPGSVVGVQFITCEEKMIANASAIAVGVLFDEISGTFTNLVNTSNDPPTLAPSKTTRATRFWTSQDGGTVYKCRHMQQQLSWPAENYANELYTNTIYGRMPEKARK